MKHIFLTFVFAVLCSFHLTNGDRIDKDAVEKRYYLTTTGTYSVFAMLLSWLLFTGHHNLQIIFRKQAWASVATAFCILMVTGQMWNIMESPPYIGGNSNDVHLIHPSYKMQHILETILIFYFIATITIGMILIIESGNPKVDIRRRRLGSIIGVLLVMIFHGLLLSVFRSKYHWYPYSF